MNAKLQVTNSSLILRSATVRDTAEMELIFHPNHFRSSLLIWSKTCTVQLLVLTGLLYVKLLFNLNFEVI